MNLVNKYLNTGRIIVTKCALGGYCDVHITNADEYPTDCYYCNSGKGNSHKVRTTEKVYSHAEGINTKVSGGISVWL